VIGRLRPTGIRPKCMDHLKAHGFDMAADAFADRRPHQDAVRSA